MKNMKNVSVVEHVPTERTRVRVKRLAGVGMKLIDIAAQLQISEKTLTSHYEEELKCGPAEANEHVCDALFEMARSKQSAATTIFWVKSRCGFLDKADTNGGASTLYRKPTDMSGFRIVCEGEETDSKK